MMVERLKQDGTSHSSRDLLKMRVKMGASCSAQVLRQESETPSGPGAFLGFCFRNSRLTSSVCILSFREEERGVRGVMEVVESGLERVMVVVESEMGRVVVVVGSGLGTVGVVVETGLGRGRVKGGEVEGVLGVSV